MAQRKGLENLEKGKRFTSEYQPENRGRKPSALSRYIKDNGVSITDIKLMIGSFVFDHTTAEITALLKDKNNPPPVGVSIILAALSEDIKNRNLTNFEKLLDRAYGKPTQKDVIEFSDIPDTAKSRLDKIFGDAQNKSGKIEPDVIAKKLARKEKNEVQALEAAALFRRIS